ncbi:hypothetical protein [Streptomyces turgidiscabies]|uniref:YD repeat-containing protein n=1 Tax=Streptomyces turgidiscabies TaxID=85558 RepID=A0ABU0RMM8_9ACTN|nr:hypothetical protein [Streptomyces turgidiscabies]MDQ0933247.1 hypothetical protein [Streptomyces turgidiscabies]
MVNLVAAGRATDSIFRVAATEKWRTKTTYHGDHTTVDDSDITYGYDAAGNILKVADAPEGKQADVQCFTYDYLRRLTEAWTQTANACAPSAGEATVGGPAPYWHSYGYDAAGNRTGEVRHATGTTGGAAITQSTMYVPKAQDTKGGTHVHALKSAEVRTATSGSSAKEVTAAQSFTYDEAGNTIRRTKAATDLSPAVDQKLDWDEEGRLSAVTPYLSGDALDEANKTSYVYGPDGSRLLRKEKGAVTLYLGSQEIRLDTAKNSVSGTRYYSHGGKKIAVRTSAGVTETALLPQMLLDVVDGAPRVTLHHGITWMDLTRDPEPNEYRLAVTLAFTGAGIAVEAFVRLDLERGMGEWPAGVHTPYRRHAEGLDLDEARAFVEARVEELCQRHDDAARLGLARRS